MQIIAKNTEIASFAEIRECSTTKSKSLHATVRFAPGQTITYFGAKEILDRPSYLTLQVGDRQHILLEPEFLQYVNHSCAPNIFFDPVERTVIALRKIEMGEELTFFYPSTEWSMDRGFDCACESEACVGYVRGAAHLPLDILAKHQLAQHIQQKLEIDRSI